MSSPVQEDPYQALGVAKDADISAVRSAHRKLVLKFHPDRIKDPVEQAKGKDVFQKVQQAYELLSDPVRRERYDDKVKIAELRREQMKREPVRSATYPMRPAPASAPMSTPREFRDGAFYEERTPAGASASYFDSRERFEEPVSRSTSRKYDEYERRPTSKSGEKEKKNTSSSKWDKPAAGMSFGTAFNLKKKAGEARERVRERESKTKEREAQATKAKTRDRDIRRERSEQQGRKAFVVSDDGSDSDTATYVSQSTVRPAKVPIRPKMEREPTRRRSPERNARREEDEDSYDDKWERHHMSTKDYIQRSQKERPSIVRADSDAHSYWEGEERGYNRRSGSDSDRRPTASKSRRPDVESMKTRSTPSMPMHTSAPVNLRAHIETREPMQQRSSSNRDIPLEREQRREMPSFARSQTLPSSRSSRKDTAPVKGSNLKHGETHDSGYGSSSPHTPEMGGISPTREPTREPLRESARQSSTRYQIVEPGEEDDSARGYRTVLVGEEERHRRVSSPQREYSDRRERKERPEKPKITTDSRTRSSRVPSSPPEIRPPMSRNESGRYAPPQSRDSRDSPRNSPPVSRHNSGRGKLFGEVEEIEPREPAPYSRRYAPEKISTSPRIDPESVNHGPYRRRDSQDDNDYFPGSRHRQELRQPGMGSRRGSVF